MDKLRKSLIQTGKVTPFLVLMRYKEFHDEKPAALVNYYTIPHFIPSPELITMLATHGMS